jgi:hypothetical protein
LIAQLLDFVALVYSGAAKGTTYYKWSFQLDLFRLIGEMKRSNVAQKHLIEIALIKKIWKVVDNGSHKVRRRM